MFGSAWLHDPDPRHGTRPANHENALHAKSIDQDMAFWREFKKIVSPLRKQ
jgi:hypothetical protein